MAPVWLGRIVLALLFCPGLWQQAAAAPPPTVTADAAVLMDATTGEVLYDKNMHQRRPPASTTKILTAIIALESGRLDEEVTVSPQAAATPGSSMYLFTGQRILLRELVAGLLMKSGNDAAVAIAQHLAGSVDAFAALMNQKAAALGALDSHFRNPHGLSAPGHYTSAFDLAWLARWALQNADFRAIVASRQMEVDWLDTRGREKTQQLNNTNQLLWSLEGADGVKTGTTSQAGQCLVASATRGDQQLIAVVLHSRARWFDATKLLQFGFATYDLYTYARQGDCLGPVPVAGGMRSLVDAVVASPAAVVVPAEDFAAATAVVDLPETLKAPLYRGQKIGEIVFYVREKPVRTVDLLSAADVEQKTPLRLLLGHLLQTFRRLAAWGLL